MTGNNLWQETPCIRSNHISTILGCEAYLKLENIHPSYSFKYRGISLFVQKAREKYGSQVHLVIASSGNAAMAVACAARASGMRSTSVYIPQGATANTVELLEREGAQVTVVGRFYAEALEAAKLAVERDENAVMVPSYDDPILWEGHGSMVQEAAKQLPAKPAAIFCSVGGGGLLGGIIVGCAQVGWEDVPIVALETIGSNCFYHSVLLNKNPKSAVLPEGVGPVHDQIQDVKLARFSAFSSRASSSLGASQPSAKVVKIALERPGGIQCVSVPDELSMQVAARFAEDHKFLVELACATTLTPGYNLRLFDKLIPKVEGGEKRTVLFIVCGGFKVSLDDMAEYRRLADVPGDVWEILCNGEHVRIEK